MKLTKPYAAAINRVPMSVHKRRLDVTTDARHDLHGILMYTESRWDKQQRRTYKATLDEAMERLRAHPDFGRMRDDLAPGPHAFPVEAHVLYYMVGEREVIIVRILHGHMDATAHFTP